MDVLFQLKLIVLLNEQDKKYMIFDIIPIKITLTANDQFQLRGLLRFLNILERLERLIFWEIQYDVNGPSEDTFVQMNIRSRISYKADDDIYIPPFIDNYGIISRIFLNHKKWLVDKQFINPTCFRLIVYYSVVPLLRLVWYIYNKIYYPDFHVPYCLYVKEALNNRYDCKIIYKLYDKYFTEFAKIRIGYLAMYPEEYLLPL